MNNYDKVLEFARQFFPGCQFYGNDGQIPTGIVFAPTGGE